MRPSLWATAALLSAIVPVSGGSEIVPLQHRLATLTGRRAELVRRLAAIEADRLEVVVLRAPVDIQDRDGHSIVFISKGGFGRGFSVINERKQSVAGVDGSTVFALAPHGGGGARLSYANGAPSLSLWNGATPVATITADGFAAFGPRSSANTQAAAQLSATMAEAGYLSLGDAAGNGLVDAGMLFGRRGQGVVRVAPFTPRPELLLPITPHRIPNFIRGYRPQ
jgi:hypothetical protein